MGVLHTTLLRRLTKQHQVKIGVAVTDTDIIRHIAPASQTQKRDQRRIFCTHSAPRGSTAPAGFQAASTPPRDSGVAPRHPGDLPELCSPTTAEDARGAVEGLMVR